jgi:hypothetical protein
MFKSGNESSYWKGALKLFPNCEELSFYRRKISNVYGSPGVIGELMASLIDLATAKKTKIRKITEMRKVPNCKSIN